MNNTITNGYDLANDLVKSEQPTSSSNKADPNLRTHWQLRIMKLYIIVDRQIDFRKELHAPKEDFIEYLRVDSHNLNLQCDYMNKLHRLMDIQKNFNL